MPNFKWTDAYELGHVDIDAQHMRMFQLAEGVVDSTVRTSFGNVSVGATELRALLDFTEEHFAFEESLMRSAGYPEAEWHVKNHASLLDELRGFCRRVQSGRVTNAVSQINYLWDWLNIHIDIVDRELVVWLSGTKSLAIAGRAK